MSDAVGPGESGHIGPPESLRPLLVSSSDAIGGAARAAYRLHHALRAGGIESSMLIRRSQLDHDEALASTTLFGKVSALARPFVEAQLQRLQRSPTQTFHSSNLLPSRLSRVIGARRPDVVNLHWIGGGTMSIADVGRIAEPVVMTLHDMWAFCGSEHYAPDGPEARWRVGYSRSNRPRDHRGLDLDRLAWKRKRRLWAPVHVVCPSRWLADCARNSALMSTWPIHVIPNPVDLEVFRPIGRSMAREILGLPPDASILLFGALGAERDPRKGYDLFEGVLRRLTQDQVAVHAVVFGQNEPSTPPALGVPVRWMGEVHDDVTLALLYGAADVVVVPSRQENLPQIATEAQACGTPVVAFDVTGLGDVVDDRRTGYLAPPYSVEGLARGVQWVLESGERRGSLSEAARQRSLRLWDPSVIVPKYADVMRLAREGQPAA